MLCKQTHAIASVYLWGKETILWDTLSSSWPPESHLLDCTSAPVAFVGVNVSFNSLQLSSPLLTTSVLALLHLPLQQALQMTNQRNPPYSQPRLLSHWRSAGLWAPLASMKMNHFPAKHGQLLIHLPGGRHLEEQVLWMWLCWWNVYRTKLV